jgi:hypothetical protein
MRKASSHLVPQRAVPFTMFPWPFPIGPKCPFWFIVFPMALSWATNTHREEPLERSEPKMLQIYVNTFAFKKIIVVIQGTNTCSRRSIEVNRRSCRYPKIRHGCFFGGLRGGWGGATGSHPNCWSTMHLAFMVLPSPTACLLFVINQPLRCNLVKFELSSQASRHNAAKTMSPNISS